MVDPASAPEGAAYRGIVTLEDAGSHGMITLRGDLASEVLRAAVSAAVGQQVPGQRGIAMEGARGVAWMSPDELLLIVPQDAAADTAAGLERALADEFALVADVSDARAVFRLRGGAVRDVMAKLCPVDFTPAAFGPGQIRRTRAAQVAVALWFSGPDEITLVCFRSVAGYVRDLLETAARPGGEVGYY